MNGVTVGTLINNMVLKIAFSVDDFAPKPGYGLLWDNDPVKYLNLLNKEFGCKFTLFSIPFSDGKPEYNWERNPGFVKKVLSTPYFEIAQHGLTHRAQKPEWGAQEFLNISNEEALQRIQEGKNIFRRVGVPIKGFKMPGWFIAPVHYNMIQEEGFEYLSDHFMGNRIIKQNGLVLVPYTLSIDKLYHSEYTDYLILHSHISPLEGNKNGWTKELYESVRQYLIELKNKTDVEFVFISELVEEQKQ